MRRQAGHDDVFFSFCMCARARFFFLLGINTKQVAIIACFFLGVLSAVAFSIPLTVYTLRLWRMTNTAVFRVLFS